MTKTPFWEESYKRQGKLDTFGGGKPSRDVVTAASFLKPGMKALDLGCGEGRNAVYLAQQGFITTASDISESGIEKLDSVCAELQLDITTSACDMREFIFKEPFDLIVNQGCLHLIRREEWQVLIDRMKEYTVPGGYHSIGVFTDTVPEPEDQRGLMVGLFKEGELLEQYRDWEIITSDAMVLEHEHPDGPRHKHATNSIIARKPL
ncbi:MAG: methyltransferase domain-containing protein [Dehalococcoidales bacterium]|nr:methyltransferase domain-containing protein [Dehalococcoidales bacterium]